MSELFQPLEFLSGATMKNRFMLAPLTNLQSHADGRLSDDEYHWLTYRAEGGFGLTMTCAAHVQAQGKGFPGQLGVFGDEHLEGLTRLASRIREYGSVAMTQLHHAGMRSPEEEIGTQPLCPSDNEETGARALTHAEVLQLTEDFIAAAERSERAGFDGVELHGAHGYMLCQFLSPTINQRNDEYGGSLENRARILFDIIDGIRSRCRPDFLLGVRLSPERFDVQLSEMVEITRRLMDEAKVDFIDLSLWDSFKEPADEAYQGRSLLSYFTDIPRNGVRLGTAGKIHAPDHARRCMEAGVDFVLLGRAAILHHDFPLKMAADPNFEPVKNPVSRDYLRSEGLGETFVDYMATWGGFVSD